MKKATKWKAVAIIMLLTTTGIVGLLDFEAIGTISGLTLLPATIFAAAWGVTTIIADFKSIKEDLFPSLDDYSEDE